MKGLVLLVHDAVQFGWDEYNREEYVQFRRLVCLFSGHDIVFIRVTENTRNL